MTSSLLRVLVPCFLLSRGLNAEFTVPRETAVRELAAFLTNPDLMHCELIERSVEFQYWSRDPMGRGEKADPVSVHFLDQAGVMTAVDRKTLLLLRKVKPEGVDLAEPMAGWKKRWILDRKNPKAGDPAFIVTLTKSGSLRVDRATRLVSTDSDGSDRHVYQELPGELSDLLRLDDKELIESFERKIKK
ncbi:MAG TPA: hypothetical protein VG796_04580 [Verrucomicrobiales bacterium]|jgi:hypothetical protein|nr:hypothetical protein [Verrucomicrobiales bacterium]